MKHEIRHDLALPLAKKAIDKAMQAYSARFADYNPTFTWSSENVGHVGFKAKGVSVTGEIEIQSDRVFVDLDVPFILRIFRGKAIAVIDREVREWIEKAKAGELDG